MQCLKQRHLLKSCLCHFVMTTILQWKNIFVGIFLSSFTERNQTNGSIPEESNASNMTFREMSKDILRNVKNANRKLNS